MYHYNMESFGSNCPDNWQEICTYLNSKLDSVLSMDPDNFDSSNPDGLSDDGREIVAKIWNEYCMEQYHDAPVPVFD